MLELRKVTCFVVRRRGEGWQVLLLRHPNAGVQYPAGTIEPGETPAEAALREAIEEAGLPTFGKVSAAGELAEELAAPIWLTAASTPLYARPDGSRLPWAPVDLRAGLTVIGERETDEMVQVTYEEFDRFPDPQHVTVRLTGWAPRAALTRARRRWFFLLPFAGSAPEAWDHAADGHTWRLFWAPADDLPPIVEPQDRWTTYLTAALAGLTA